MLIVSILPSSKVSADYIFNTSDSTFSSNESETKTAETENTSSPSEEEVNLIESTESFPEKSLDPQHDVASASAAPETEPALLRSDLTTLAKEKLQELKKQLDQSKGIGIYIGDNLTISIDGTVHLDYTLSDQSVVTYDGLLSFEKPTYQKFPSTKTELTGQSLDITRERESLDKKFYETLSARWHFTGKKTIDGMNPVDFSISQVENTWEYPLSVSLILNVDIPPLIVDAPRGTSKENPILIEKGTAVSEDPKDYFSVVSSGYDATVEWHVKPDFSKENEFTAELGIRDKFDQYWTVNGQSSVIIYFKVVEEIPEYLTTLTTQISYTDITLEDNAQGISVSNSVDADTNTKLHSIPAQLNYMRFSFPNEFVLLSEAISMEAVVKSTDQKIPIGQDEYSILTAGHSFSLTNLSKRIEMFYAQEELIIHYDLRKLTRLSKDAYCTFETNYSPQNSENNVAKTLAKIQEPENLLTLSVPEDLEFSSIEIGQKNQAALTSVAPNSLCITDNREQKSAVKLFVDLSNPLKESSGREMLGTLLLKNSEAKSLDRTLFYEGALTGLEGASLDLTQHLSESLRLTIPKNEQSGRYQGLVKWTLISDEP